MTHERNELLKLVPASSEWPEGARYWTADKGGVRTTFYRSEPRQGGIFWFQVGGAKFGEGVAYQVGPPITLPDHIPWDQTLVSLGELQEWENARVPEPLGPITKPIDKKPSQKIVQPPFEVPLEDEPGHGWTDAAIKKYIWGKYPRAETLVHPHFVCNYMRKVRSDVETYYQEQWRDDQEAHAADLSLRDNRIAELEAKLTQAEKAAEARADQADKDAEFIESLEQERDRWATAYWDTVNKFGGVDNVDEAAELHQMVRDYETLYKDDDVAPKLTLWPDRFVSLIDGNGHNMLPLSDNTWSETTAWLKAQPEDKRVTAEQLATALERACSYGKSGIGLVDGGYEETEAVLYQYREHGLKTEE